MWKLEATVAQRAGGLSVLGPRNSRRKLKRLMRASRQLDLSKTAAQTVLKNQ